MSECADVQINPHISTSANLHIIFFLSSTFAATSISVNATLCSVKSSLAALQYVQDGVLYIFIVIVWEIIH